MELGALDKKITLEQFDRMIKRKASEYTQVDLTANISHLSDNQKEMLRLLFRVANIMEDLYWEQVFPDRDAALGSMVNEDLARFFRINYGPWERLNGNLPYLPDYGAKPAGSGYYPADMTKDEFEAIDDPAKTSLYTIIRRQNDGILQVIPYHEEWADQVKEAAELLNQASELAEDQGFKKYLKLRAEALLTDDYLASDLAWMDMKNNEIDFVVGPIETYEDALFNYKAAHESFILIKDMEWSKKLAYISSVLPQMQKSLPVPPEYKKEIPGSDSDLGAYDVVYYSGDCNAGSKTIAINLPNDETVQLQKGTRRLQLKNAMRAKFDIILKPISEILIDSSQQKHITFDAFFANTMFHEVAHGLGIKNTINNKGTVRKALKEQASALEEGKADILGLYMVQQLHEKGELEGDMKDYMTTFMAGIFRSVRFGASSAHGKANMIRFNFFKTNGAFTKNEDGTYKVNYDKMDEAIRQLSYLILTLQGNGDYDGVVKLVEEKGIISADLQRDLDKLSNANIPVDVIFEQGIEVL